MWARAPRSCRGHHRPRGDSRPRLSEAPLWLPAKTCRAALDQTAGAAAPRGWWCSLRERLARAHILLQEFALLEFLKRLPQLLLGVHHDGTVPGHRFLQRLSRNQKKTDPIISGLHRDFVPAVEEDE